MAEPNWPRHGFRLGVTGVKRRLRRLRRNRLRLRLLGVSLFFSAIGFGGVGLLVALWLRGVDGPIPVPGQIRLGVAVLWLFAVWFFAQRAIVQWGHLRKKSFVLTTVSSRTATVAMLLTEFATAALALVLPSMLLVGIVGIAFSAPFGMVSSVVAVGLFAATAIVVGYVLGFGYLFAGTPVRLSDRLQGNVGMHLVLLAVTGYAVAYVVFDVPAVWDSTSFEWMPVGWFVDLALLGTAVTASVEHALAGFIGSVAVLVAGGLVLEKLAATYWCTDPAVRRSPSSLESPSNGTARSLMTTRLPRPLWRRVPTPTRWVATIVLLRIRRAPRRTTVVSTVALSFVLWTGVVLTQLEQPMLTVPFVCLVFVPWLAGATFSMNPFGDASTVLPATLTSSITGAQYVHGLVLPGILYGTPLACLSTFGTALVGPYTVLNAATLAIVAAVLTPIAVIVGTTIGMYFPRFRAMSIGERRDVVPPSMTAIALYSLCIGGLGWSLITVFNAPSSVFSAFEPVGLSPLFSRILVAGGFLCGVLVLANWCYRKAVFRFDGWTLS